MSWKSKLKNDLRSAIVSAVIAGLVGAMTGIAARNWPTDNKWRTYPDQYGRSFIAPLFKEVEDEKVKIRFSPETIRDCAICRYYDLKASSFEKIMVKFLKKNKDCFNYKIKNGVYEITIPDNGDKLKVKDGKYYCKCPDWIVNEEFN